MRCVFFNGKKADPERSEWLASQNKEEERRGASAAVQRGFQRQVGHVIISERLQSTDFHAAQHMLMPHVKKKKKCVQIHSELCCIFMPRAKKI